MSVQFERLSAGFINVDNVQGQALPKETRSLKQWLDNLPRGNAKEMAQMLRNALAHSIAVKMDGSIRFSLLEMLRPDVIDSVTWLERQFIGSPLPLTLDRLNNAKQTLELHVLFGGHGGMLFRIGDVACTRNVQRKLPEPAIDESAIVVLIIASCHPDAPIGLKQDMETNIALLGLR